jgi:hypothetical protein
MLASHEAREIAAGPSQAHNEPRANWIGDVHEHNRDCLALTFQRGDNRHRISEDDIGFQTHQLLREHSRLSTCRRKADVNMDIAALRPSKPFQLLAEQRNALLHFRIGPSEMREYADAPHALAVLRLRCERPRRRTATGKPDELAPVHARCLPCFRPEA